MTPNQFLKDQLESCGHYQLTDQDKDLIKNVGIEEYIYKKLTSKKFRKWSINQDNREKIRYAINFHTSRQKPIVFTSPFGGYKLWRLPTAPEPDWAEFFTLSYSLNYLTPVAAAYKPGARLIISSDEVIIKRMNNIPLSDTDQYTKNYQKLVNLFNKYLPKNIQLEFIKIRDLYSKTDLETELAPLVKTQIKILNSLDQKTKDSKMIMSEFNINLKGVEDWSKLSNKQQKDKIKMGSIYHDAYIQLKKRVELIKDKDKIIIFPTLIPNTACVPIGSTKASVTKFWTGFGILEKRKDSYLPKILSPKQLISHKNKPHQELKPNLISLKNFSTIKVY